MRGDVFFRQVSGQPPFSRLHPQLAGYLQEYLSQEKITRFGERFVVNTHFPPFPSPAFDNLVAQFDRIGTPTGQRLHSVTLAITNRCPYRCWHCYNAGRCQQDLSLEQLRSVAGQLQDLGTVMVALSGGEPLLRDDLEDLAAAFDERTCLTLNTTGYRLTPQRAQSLRASGVFALGVSLDSADAQEHDRLRGHAGAYRAALDALRTAADSALYPYVVAVATRQFLQEAPFREFVDLVAGAGAREVHLLEPCPSGRLAGREDVVLDAASRQRLLDYQRAFAQREDLPVLSSYAYLESADRFGCGAGLTHLYIDGSGEVCPCNLVPLSFGNIGRDRLDVILQRMGAHFHRPRTGCVGQLLNRHVPDGPLPTPPEISRRLCEAHLPAEHPVPRFFRLREQLAEVGPDELRAAYDHVHDSYDEFWVREAGKPVAELLGRIDLHGVGRALEAGCGTGYATALLAAGLPAGATLTAVDLSAGMLEQARRRLADHPEVRFVAGDALAHLVAARGLDLVLSTWVLGYIAPVPFYAAAAEALTPGGLLAFLVHRQHSPREPLEIFAELVARDPGVLRKRVEFGFPHDMLQVRNELAASGFVVDDLWEGEVVFRYAGAEQVLEHLLKSGAGTAFHEAIAPPRRDELTGEFVRLLAARHRGEAQIAVVHQYIAGIARIRPQR